jgi:hypothetical protein
LRVADGEAFALGVMAVQEITEGELAASLVILMLPAELPADDGESDAVKVIFWPGIKASPE